MSRTQEAFTIRVGREELTIRRRYVALSIANDVLIALWFVAGSGLFLWGATAHAGTWMFLVGSIEFLARPLIRLARRLHLRRLHPDLQDDEPSFEY